MKQAGIMLIVIGFVLSIYTTFSFFTRDKVLDLGRVEITKDKEHSLSWSPAVGIILLGLGGILVWKSFKK